MPRMSQKSHGVWLLPLKALLFKPNPNIQAVGEWRGQVDTLRDLDDGR